MSDTKRGEKERLSPKALAGMKDWLTTMPLSIQNPEKNLFYIADFLAVAAHLQLPQNSRILELGAGACWASEWFYRMGYRTVSTDISAEMLGVGRERFLPLRRERDNYALFAHFVCADAEQLPFADGTFDAVVVFNAFHHFPNLPSAMDEIHRVLAEPGKFLLAEPGEGHSETDESKREMAEHGVQEKDVIIDEVARLAAAAGFGSSEVIVTRFPDTAMPIEHWRRFARPWRGWRYKTRLVGDLVHRQKVHPCMVMRKGEGGMPDSRRPGLLRASLAVLEMPEAVQAGHPFRVRAKAANRGDTRWICQGTFLASGSMNLGEGGYVALGAKLREEDGKTLDNDFGRSPLAADVAPGEELEIEALFLAPENPGLYRLKLDLVDEGIVWFEDCGSETVESALNIVRQEVPPVFDSRFPGRLEAAIVLSPNSREASPGESVEVSVTVQNRGDTVWLVQAPTGDSTAFGGGYVRLGWHLRDGEGQLVDLNYGRASLPADVGPGEKVELAVSVEAPERTGACRITFDLVDEEIAWFADRGSPTAALDLVVK